MDSSKKKTLWIVALAIILGIGFGYFIFRSEPKEIVVEKLVEVENTQKIDSLNTVIKLNEILIESLKDSVREKIVYVEKKVEEIKELPIDENLMLLRDNLFLYGEYFDPSDSLPSLCQLSNSEDTLVLMSEDNIADVNIIVAKYEGTLEINNFYFQTIQADSSIIDLKNSIISEKDDIINQNRINFESNMRDLEQIIQKERRKQIYYTVGGMIVAGTLTYLILK